MQHWKIARWQFCTAVKECCGIDLYGVLLLHVHITKDNFNTHLWCFVAFELLTFWVISCGVIDCCCFFRIFLCLQRFFGWPGWVSAQPNHWSSMVNLQPAPTRNQMSKRIDFRTQQDTQRSIQTERDMYVPHIWQWLLFFFASWICELTFMVVVIHVNMHIRLILVGYGVTYIQPTYHSLVSLQEFDRDPGVDFQNKVKVCLIDQESHVCVVDIYFVVHHYCSFEVQPNAIFLLSFREISAMTIKLLLEHLRFKCTTTRRIFAFDSCAMH